MQFIGARRILLQTPDNFFCPLDAGSTFSNQIRSTLFDRTDFSLKADADSIELTGRDAKTGLNGRLEFADLMACAPLRKKRSLYPPVQCRLCVEHACRLARHSDPSLVGEDRTITHVLPVQPGQHGAWLNAFHKVGHTSTRSLREDHALRHHPPP